MSESAERLREVYIRMRPTLIRGLAATVGSYDGVDDAVQEAFMRALETDPRKIASMEGWLYTVALNSLRRGLRRNGLLHALRLSVNEPRDALDDALTRP
jgi:DNA-directed RNA polymerase specialized sigma24 family protein